MPINNPDSPAVKKLFASATAERFVALYEQAGFTREKDFAVRTRGAGSTGFCTSQFIMGDKLHKNLVINVKVKSLDCSIGVAIARRDNQTADNPDAASYVRTTPPIRLRMNSNHEGQPTPTGEEAVLLALDWLKQCLDALKSDGDPQDIIDTIRQSPSATPA